jgi:uncharacterized membrane protein
MVLIRFRLIALVTAGLAASVAGPGQAHKNHQQAAPESATDAPTISPSNAGAAAGHDGMAMDETPPAALSERAVAWLGKMHPAGVHFPIALFPAAFVLLALARRREGVAAVARWLIIVAGLAAAGAALMGWISAGFAMSDLDPIQAWHRWIGTGLAAAGLGAALWAWRRPGATGNRGTVALTGAISLAILIQGGLGGVITHGLEHLRF